MAGHRSLWRRRMLVRVLLPRILLNLSALLAAPAQGREALPPNQTLILSNRGGQVNILGIGIDYAIHGHNWPLIPLRSGNCGYWSNEVELLGSHRTALVSDSRGPGRNTRDSWSYSGEQRLNDIVGPTGRLSMPKADIVTRNERAPVSLWAWPLVAWSASARFLPLRSLLPPVPRPIDYCRRSLDTELRRNQVRFSVWPELESIKPVG